MNSPSDENTPRIATEAAPMINGARLSYLADSQTVNQIDKLASVLGGTVILCKVRST